MTLLLVMGVIVAGGAVMSIIDKEMYIEVLGAAKKGEPKMLFCHEYNISWADKLQKDLGYPIVGIVMGACEQPTLRSTPKHFDYYYNYDHSKSAALSRIPVACKDPWTELMLLSLSSGTTGKPKLVPSTHGCCLYDLEMDLKKNRHRHTNMYVSLAAPIDYVSCRITLLRSLALGDTVVIMNEVDSKSCLEVLERYKLNYIFLGAASFYSLITHPDLDKYDISSVRSIFPTGAKITYVEELREFLNKHPHINMVRNGYGTTESGIISLKFSTPEEYLVRPFDCGKIITGVRVKVVDPETGALLSHNEKGIAHVKSKFIFPGYYNMEIAREEARKTGKPICPFIGGPDVFDEDGFYITGDIIYLDEDENLIVVGREKELMVCRGGMKCLPQNIEAIVAEHPAVSEVCVTAIPHKSLKNLDCPRAFIVLKQDCATRDLQECLTSRIGQLELENHSHTGNHKLSSLPVERRRKISEDIMDFLNERVNWETQLTGGIVIIDTLPAMRKSGKVDKTLLKSLDEDQVEICGDKTGSRHDF